jgi:hypothetical protein
MSPLPASTTSCLPPGQETPSFHISPFVDALIPQPLVTVWIGRAAVNEPHRDLSTLGMPSFRGVERSGPNSSLDGLRVVVPTHPETRTSSLAWPRRSVEPGLAD